MHHFLVEDLDPEDLRTEVAYVNRHMVPRWRTPTGRLERIAREARVEATARVRLARTHDDEAGA